MVESSLPEALNAEVRKGEWGDMLLLLAWRNAPADAAECALVCAEDACIRTKELMRASWMEDACIRTKASIAAAMALSAMTHGPSVPIDSCTHAARACADSLHRPLRT